MIPDENVRFFSSAWLRLSQLGKCDDFGGAEYRRILNEWIAAAYPYDVVEFITCRANWSPGSPYPVPLDSDEQSKAKGDSHGA